MKGLQAALIFLAGGAVGAGVTYLLTKEHFQAMAQAEIDDMRDWLNERAKARNLDDEITGDSLTCENREELINRYRGYLQELGYAPDEEAESAVNPTDDDTSIEKISCEEFTDGYAGYSSETLSYYAGDGTWVGTDDTVLSEDDVCVAVGNDLYDEIEGIRKNVSVDTESLYIANHEMAALYEIMFLPGKYMNAE